MGQHAFVSFQSTAVHMGILLTIFKTSDENIFLQLTAKCQI
jgi:hypothetical protein